MTAPDLIIDGYNLLKSTPDFSKKYINLSAQREHLIKIIASNPKLRKRQVLLVFDGSGVKTETIRSAQGAINIIYTKRHQAADDLIQQIIRRAKHPGNINVVSSDREIQYTAKSHGAKVIESPTFWKNYFTKSSSKEKKNNSVKYIDRELSDKEVRKWLDIFQHNTPEKDEN